MDVSQVFLSQSDVSNRSPANLLRTGRVCNEGREINGQPAEQERLLVAYEADQRLKRN